MAALFSKLMSKIAGPGKPKTPEEAAERATKVHKLLEQADARYKSGEIEKAVKIYKEVLSLDPKNVPAFTNLGAIYSQQPGKTSDAIVVMECARNLDPSNHTVQLNLATLYTQQSNFDSAKQVLEDLRKRDPQAPGLHYTLGCVYFYNNEVDEAVEQFEKEVETNPNHPHAKEFLEKLRQETGGAAKQIGQGGDVEETPHEGTKQE